MYNYPPGTMSNKQNVGATGLGARSNQEWYNCGGFNWGISIESKCGIRGVIMYEVQYIVT